LNILVTGAAGFIGSHLVEKLVQKGYNVRGMDDFSTGQNRVGCDEFLNTSVEHYATCWAAIKDMDVIYHLAAIPSVPRSIKEPHKAHIANVDGIANILEACRQDSKFKGKFIFASSSSADYELSPYAMHKRLGEKYIKLYNSLYGLNAVSLRFFNVFGPRQRDDSEYSAVIPLMLKAKRENALFKVHGSGNQVRDFTYINNLVHVLVNMLDLSWPFKTGGVYDVGLGVGTSINELGKLVGLDKVQYVAGRKGDVSVSVAKPSFPLHNPVSVKEGIEMLLKGK